MFRAFVFDVLVTAECRGQGLGLSLIEQIPAHPELAQVQSIQLSCLPELTQFYAKLGFATSEQVFILR